MSKSDLNAVQTRVGTEMDKNAAFADPLAKQAAAGYGEFSKTGGVSPEEEALARKETSYGIGSLYDSLQRNLKRRKAVQGGYAPGMGAQSAQLGRNASEQIARGITGTNLGLLQQQRQGRLAGLSGLSGLTSLYQRQIPQYLGIGARAASQTPGIAESISNWANTIGDVSGVISGFGGSSSGD